jgi:hypothetical protein
MSMVKSYRKKPVVIEALLLRDSEKVSEAEWEAHVSEIHDFLGSQDWDGDPEGVNINTLEGVMHASPGDYIIKGVKGEFYPCKPDIFAATYDEVN